MVTEQIRGYIAKINEVYDIQSIEDEEEDVWVYLRHKFNLTTELLQSAGWEVVSVTIKEV